MATLHWPPLLGTRREGAAGLA